MALALTGAKAFKAEEEARKARMEEKETQAQAETEEGYNEISTGRADEAHGDLGDGDLDGDGPARDEQVPTEKICRYSRNKNTILCLSFS